HLTFNDLTTHFFREARGLIPDLTSFFPLIIPFLLVLFRLVGVFVFVPFFSNSSIPANVRVLLSVAMAFCVWNVVPLVQRDGGGVMVTPTLPGVVVAVAGEMSVGLVIGLLV